eukprot:gene34135-biopygen15827
MRWLRQPPPRFDHGVSLLDTTPLQQIWLDKEIERALGTGAWKRASRRQHVSRVFLVKKPGVNKWRVVDFRFWLNSFSVKSKDGYYAVGIDPDFQKYIVRFNIKLTSDTLAQ